MWYTVWYTKFYRPWSGVTEPFSQSTLVNGQGVVCPLTVVHGTRTRAQGELAELKRCYFVYNLHSIVQDMKQYQECLKRD